MSVDTEGGHPAMDYNEHNRTYAGFVTFVKASIIFLALLLVGMAVFIA